MNTKTHPRHYKVRGTKLLPKDSYLASMCDHHKHLTVKQLMIEGATERRVMGYDTRDVYPYEKRIIKLERSLSTRARKDVIKCLTWGRCPTGTNKWRYYYALENQSDIEKIMRIDQEMLANAY